MNWSLGAQAASDLLSIVLIFRLLSLKLHSVYRIFCAYLAFDLVSSLIGLAWPLVHPTFLDYRLYWISIRVVSWVFWLCIVYNLLHAILLNLPGIYKASKKLLNVTFVSVVALSLLTVRLDIAVSGSSGYLSRFVDPLGRAVRVAFDLDRVISTVALFVLLLILGFVLWFPVRMPKNLAIFSIGFVVYFASNTGLMLTRGIWSIESLRLVSTVIIFIVTACYAYWAVFITSEGERAAVTLGHTWQPSERDRLIGQLEAMNTALLRARR